MKIITYTDRNYFQYGKLFLLTRKLIDAHFILYGPDLTKEQKNIVKEHDIEFRDIDENLFQKRMQCLKFDLIVDNIDQSVSGEGGAFLDFDTFFMKNWDHIYQYDFDVGITFRESHIKQKILRAYANGGVILYKNTESSKKFFQWTLNIIENYGSHELPEYNTIFRTFERGSNRPDHKIWNRKDLRWWVDQVFLSCFPYAYLKENNCKKISKISKFKYKNKKILLLPCSKYNYLDPTIKDIDNKDVYIFHLKKQGRDIVNKLDKKLNNAK